MRIPACPLFLALIACASSVQNISGAAAQTVVHRSPAHDVAEVSSTLGKSRPIRQSPQTGNVRPRVALISCKSSGEAPLVNARANRILVPLGELVTFTFSPAKIVLDPRYTVIIIYGDGTEERILQKTRINHLYTTTGTFTYCVLVKPPQLPTTPTLPAVSLSATPTSVKAGSLVNFKAQLSHDYPNIRYRFMFADGSDTGWQGGSLAPHRYGAPGTYPAYVEIGLGNGGPVKRVDSSPRKPIEVTAPESRKIAVQLKTDRVIVQAKGEIRFLAQVDPFTPNVEYHFSFGDRSSTEWQISPQQKHVYGSSGTYRASVEVRVMNSRPGQQTATSRPLSIKVEPEKLPVSRNVDLFVAPRSVIRGLPVYFRAVVDSANSRTRYRFNFGDGTVPGEWKQAAEETHIYSLAGNYPAFVEVLGNPAASVAASGKKQITVIPVIPIGPTENATPSPNGPTPSPVGPTQTMSTPTPAAPTPTPVPSPSTTSDGSPSPAVVLTSSSSPSESASPTPTPPGAPSDDWWKYLLLALILYAGYRGWKYLFAPGVTLEPQIDPGVAGLGAEGGPLSINFQMELDPDVNDGKFSVDTTEPSLIKSERKSDG